MFKKMVPLNSRQHVNKKILPINNFKFAQNSYIVSLLANEFIRAASAFPIVFVDDNGELRPFAMLGLKRGENLFVDEQGRWRTHYIPAVIRRYPFILGRQEDKADFMLCIDEESEFFSDDQGEPLFTEDGQPGEIIGRAKDYLVDLQKFNELTNIFSRDLSKRELLSPLNMQLRSPGGTAIKIDGIHAVNENKLNEMSDDDFREMRKRGILPLIYAHLVSLTQMERLVQMQSEKDK
jgi:hypothetical protein